VILATRSVAQRRARTVRRAFYNRKSTDDRVDIEFSSLDAQSEAVKTHANSILELLP